MSVRLMLDSIDLLSFSGVRRKLMDKNDGKNWTYAQAILAEREYRRFLKLNALHPDGPIVPSLLMDTFWHYHILDTRKYQYDMLSVFGRFLHHDPNFGMEGSDSERELMLAAEGTRLLYLEAFGEPMPLSEEEAGVSHCCACRSAFGVTHAGQ